MSKLNRIVATGLAAALAFLTFTGAALAAGKPAPAGKVNLNSASVEQLSALPGVGPKLAARIVEYRQKSGRCYRFSHHLEGKGARGFRSS